MTASANRLRVGVIGLGNIGARHVGTLASDATPDLQLTAVAARNGVPAGLSLAPSVQHFADFRDMLTSGIADAVIVATPTHLHQEMGSAVLESGLHLLMEKPLGISVSQAKALIEKAEQNQVFAVMLNQRFDPAYARLHSLIGSGELGELRRVSWTMTQWYRPDVYFRVSSWRGTWPGEGGGVLINQCIHNLDILQWLTGMPGRLRAFAGFGKHHSIDVEDEVTAWFEYDNGATGVVVASTGEAPGFNQLDLVYDRATLRYDGKHLSLQQAEESVAQHCRETMELFGMPEFASSEESPEPGGDQHAQLLNNFASAVRGDAALLTPAEEGLRSLELANAMLLSAWTDEVVELPLDASRYDDALNQRLESADFRVAEQLEVDIDIEKSFR